MGILSDLELTEESIGGDLADSIEEFHGRFENTMSESHEESQEEHDESSESNHSEKKEKKVKEEWDQSSSSSESSSSSSSSQSEDVVEGAGDVITGGAGPLAIGLVIFGLMILIGAGVIAGSYYADDWLDWSGMEITDEGKHWGARSGGIMMGLGVAGLGGIGGFYMIKASKFWGAMIALVIVGIMILTVTMLYSSQEWMKDIFGPPPDEDALYWAKVAGGITIGVGMLGIIGRSFFKGGKKYAKYQYENYKLNQQAKASQRMDELPYYHLKED